MNECKFAVTDKFTARDEKAKDKQTPTKLRRNVNDRNIIERLFCVLQCSFIKLYDKKIGKQVEFCLK